MNRVLLVAAVASVTLHFGCSASSPGRCVGSATPDQASALNVLVNVNSQGVALDGHDPVAFFTDGKPIKGLPEIASTYGGAAYHFASVAHKAAFDAEPAKYAPQFGGYCAYAASISKISPISVEYWDIVGGRLILQHNQKAWDAWKKDPNGNLVKADANWPGLVERNGAPARTLVNIDASGLALEGYDPVSYFGGTSPVKGDPGLARTYQGATYHFATSAHKDAFEQDPAKYVPAFGGFCGYAASINKISPVNPVIWQLVDGRLVLQHTPTAYDLFNKDVPGNYARAEQNWPGLVRGRCR